MKKNCSKIQNEKNPSTIQTVLVPPPTTTVFYGIKVACTQNYVQMLRKYLWHRNTQKLIGY